MTQKSRRRSLRLFYRSSEFGGEHDRVRVPDQLGKDLPVMPLGDAAGDRQPDPKTVALAAARLVGTVEPVEQSSEFPGRGRICTGVLAADVHAAPRAGKRKADRRIRRGILDGIV